jgi:hypothetical protein
MAACGAAQLGQDHWEAAPDRIEKVLIHRLCVLESTSWALMELGRVVAQGSSPTGIVARWATVARLLDGPPRANLRGLHPLVEQAQHRPLSEAERREFQERLLRLIQQVWGEQQLAQRWLWQLHRDPRYGWTEHPGAKARNRRQQPAATARFRPARSAGGHRAGDTGGRLAPAGPSRSPRATAPGGRTR